MGLPCSPTADAAKPKNKAKTTIGNMSFAAIDLIRLSGIT